MNKKIFPGSITERGLTSELISRSDYKGISRKQRLLKNKISRKKEDSGIDTIGDEKNFFVRNIFNQDKWDTTTAVLSYSKPGIHIWVQRTAYDTLLGTAQWVEIEGALDEFLFHSTLSNSVHPDKGMLEIMDQYVGEFPDVDNDQILDVLLLDINDGFEESGSFVAGFFDPVNLYEFEYSNKRDLIYLDIYPTLIHNGEVNIERTLSTLVHESQHLIHAGYEGEEEELVFVNEGFSEAAEILVGFNPRDELPFNNQPLRSLLDWDHGNPLPDYSRASLWMHYLMEQLGEESLNAFIREKKTGLDGYREVVSSYSSRTFEELFRDWGLALIVNDKNQNPAYGYGHPSRQQSLLLNILEEGLLPAVFSAPLSGLVHIPVSFPLSKELNFSMGKSLGAESWLSSVVSYPSDDLKEIETTSNSSIYVQADQLSHGSIQTLITLFGDEEPEHKAFSFFADGLSSGRTMQRAYGDGDPDPFYLNASYLSLDGVNQKLGVVFPPLESAYWLQNLFIQTVFKSELEHSGIEGDAPRNFTVDLFTVKQGLPDRRLIPTTHFEALRESGKLVGEVFSLSEYYTELSSIQDSIIVIISNAGDDQNFIALGMDHGDQNAAFFSNQAPIREGWVSLSKKSVGEQSLDNWNPIIQLEAVLADVDEVREATITNMDYNFTEVQVRIAPTQLYDSTSVRLSAQLPDGNFSKGRLISKEEDIFTYALPVLVNGHYTLYSSYNSPEGDYRYKDEKQWSIDIPNGFELSYNYPNPFNPTTTIPFMLLEQAVVGWDIYDVTGRLVLSIPQKTYESGQYVQEINLQDQASGMYLVRARLNRERSAKTTYVTQKIVLIK